MSGHQITIRFAPDGQQVLVPAGTTLLRAAQQTGRDIAATCGARGRCRSCRVKVVSGTVPPAGLADRIQLGEDEVRERYRLACQTAVADDLTVLIAPALEEGAFQILAGTGDLRSATGCSLDSGVRKIFVRPQPPSREDHQSSDLEELLREVAEPVTEVPLQVLRTIPSLLRSASDGLTLTRFDQGLLALEAGDTSAQSYGMAFDIGTTTVVGYLVDLSGGEVLDTASSLNPQSAFVLALGAETAAGKDILLTQADIRQVQLAKGAIKSGIAMLQRLREAPDGRIEELMLAGGFGNT
ncbi:MAG: 2Fe-2S iron-sulfur cluster binding domain-containing protein [candidate division NC10 bacterium]|nr:2Fe-2S iron-sulfur cluster binding domain-containing protein [candidate division NC10 bacterium]